ncbi:MAG: cell envelope integrity EipB family protein [Alphaproteobacteria bacterium]|nr:cell envelope integrity EipB family protein [Alphaproteobacteria bacterium]
MVWRNLVTTAIVTFLAIGPACATESVSPPAQPIVPAHYVTPLPTPHRAVYNLSLATTRSGNGVLGASGRMIYALADTCDGWTTETHNSLEITDDRGTTDSSGWDLISWESKDGLNYRFHVRSTESGKVSETIDGTAHLTSPGGAGVAQFTAPEVKTIPLPKGTLFPTQHTMALLAHAAAGEKIMARSVFDGSEVGPPWLINAVLGQELPAGTAGELADPLLKETPSRRFGMAYYKTDDEDPVPYQQIQMRYHDNQIAEEVHQDFGLFSINAHLTELKPLPKPDC